jgi:hypothetical protein
MAEHQQSSAAGRSPYSDLDPTPSGEHPVAALLERRLPQRGLRRRIRHASQRLIRALGDRHGLWLALEERLAEYRAVREEAHFNLGFEHDFAAGQAQVVRSLLGVGDRVERLARQVREQALLHDGLSSQERALALLQAAWAVGFSSEAESVAVRDGCT